MMKLGADALVFTCRDESSSVGLLSVSMHELENLDEIIIPIVEFKKKKNKFEMVDTERDDFSYNVIEKYAAACFGLNSWKEIHEEFKGMYNHEHGTKLLVALSAESKSILRLNRPDHDIEVHNFEHDNHYAYESSLRAKMLILYQEEEAGACAEFYIDGEKLDLLRRNDIFDQFDTKRLFPASGALAKLKLPPAFYDEDNGGSSNQPEIGYQLCYIHEACGQVVTQPNFGNPHYGHDIYMRHGKGVWRLIQVGQGCKDWDNDTKHDQHVPRRERLGYGVRLVSYCAVAKELMETRPTKDGFNVSKDLYKQYKNKFKRVITNYTSNFGTKDPNKRKRVTEADHLAAGSSFGTKSTKAPAIGEKRSRTQKGPEGAVASSKINVHLRPEQDTGTSGGPKGSKKNVVSLPKRIKITLLHNRAVELAKLCLNTENEDGKNEILKELWQVQQFADEVDFSAAWPAEITNLVGNDLAAYKEKLSDHEFVTDDLGPGWDGVENMVDQLVWARIGTSANSLDSWWWAAKVVGRSGSEKDSLPKQRKVTFFGDATCSYLGASSKYLLPFSTTPPKQEAKHRLPRAQHEQWQLGVQMAVIEFEGIQPGASLMVRYTDDESGQDSWFKGVVQRTEKLPGQVGQTLYVRYEDGVEEVVTYPSPDVVMDAPTKIKASYKPKKPKEVVEKHKAALDIMYSGVVRGGEDVLRDFMMRHGLNSQGALLVEKGMKELEQLLEDFVRDYDPSGEYQGSLYRKLRAVGLLEDDSRKVMTALRIENQTRLRKAMAGLAAGA